MGSSNSSRNNNSSIELKESKEAKEAKELSAFQFEKYLYSDVCYDDLNNVLKTTKGILNALRFIHIIREQKCIHDVGTIKKYCNDCKNITGNREIVILTLPLFLSVYIPLYPRNMVQVRLKDEKEMYITVIDLLAVGYEEDSNIKHVKRIQPFVNMLTSFYDKFNEKKLCNPIIDLTKDKFLDYRQIMERDFKTINSFDEINKITNKLNQDLNKNSTDDTNEGFECFSASHTN